MEWNGQWRASLQEELNKILAETTVRRLSIEIYENDSLRSLFQLENMDQFTELHLWGDQIYGFEESSDECMEILLEADNLRNLRSLTLYECLRSEEHCHRLAVSKQLENLTEFCFDVSSSDMSEIKQFTKSTWFHQLQHLEISGDFEVEQLHALFDSGPYPNLHTLRIFSYVDIMGLGWLNTLANSKNFPQLMSLSLNHTLIHGRMLRNLLESLEGSLVELDLNNCHIDTSGMEAIASTPASALLRILRLRNNYHSNLSLHELTKSKYLRNLRVLDLSEARMDEHAFLKLSMCDNLESLTTFTLRLPEDYPCFLSVSDVDTFFKTVDWPKLRHVELTGIPMHVQGANALANESQWSKLRMLKLADCIVLPRGAEALIQSPHFQGLLSLDLSGNSISNTPALLLDPKVLPELLRLNICDANVPMDVCASQRKARPLLDILP